MNILITGSNGQLGREMQFAALPFTQHIFFFTDIDSLDICDPQAIEHFVIANQIELIVNCAAYTAVDQAEEQVALCQKINRDAVHYLGVVAQKQGAKVIHISTDYVFDGTNHTPYRESDPVCPQSVYGKTKLEGEQLLLEAAPDSIIIRTSWLYSIYGNNFVKTMIRLGSERPTLGVIFDQIGTPTYGGDLAKTICQIINNQQKWTPGVYHFSNEGVCSWYDFTVSIHRLVGIRSCQVHPIHTSDYPTKAARPPYSVLDKSKIKETFDIQIPHWEYSLRKCIYFLQEIKAL